MALKKNKTPKKTTKKETKKVEETVVETVNNEMEIALDAIEDEDKVEEVNEVKEEVVEQDPPLETVNGDPAVVAPKDEILEIQEEALNNTFKENKKHKKLIDSMIGYSWNGQEIDFIL